MLSFSGWVGFFGYELLAFQFGIPTKAKRDLLIPAGWFGRPATIVHLNQEQTVIESRDPNREKEIEKRLQDPLSLDSPTVTHQKHSCNLSLSNTKIFFIRQGRQSLMAKLIRSNFTSALRQQRKSILFQPSLNYKKVIPPKAFLLKIKSFRSSVVLRSGDS